MKKMLIQTDEKCEKCTGGGIIGEIKYKENGEQYTSHHKCEKCFGTGKKLKWINIMFMGNSIYLLKE